MNRHFTTFSFFAFLLLIIFTTTEARYERVGFVSDPIKLLLQDSYSSLKNRLYSQKNIGWRKPGFRQIRKRKFTAFPPTFYTSYDIGALPFNSRRTVIFPYNDLLFSG